MEVAISQSPSAPTFPGVWRRLVRRSLAAGLVALSLTLPAAAWGGTAPDPGGDENAILHLPMAGKQFGFSGLFNSTELDTGLEASLVRVAGGRTARMPVTWWGMEPVRDVWDEAVWARHALAYNAFRAQGVTPQFLVTASPPWARDAGAPRQCLTQSTCTYPPARAMLGEWKEFVAELVRRFPAATIEIWNEPNSFGEWRTGVDPARYAELLAAADQAAAAVNPSVPVLMAGLGSSVGGGWMPMRDFLQGAYAASPSLKRHTDAINLHLYSSGKVGAGTPFAQWLADIRAVRAANGDQTTPIFVSETGATTSGALAVSEGVQSDIVMRTVTKLLTMPDVSGVLVNSLVDRGELAADDPERGLGLLRDGLLPPLTPKRAYCQLSRAAGSLYSQCPPLALIQAGPQGLTNQASPEFRFSATEPGASFECSLNGAPFAPCSSPKRYSILPEGPHRFSVRAIGALGRKDAEPIFRQFMVDVTPPDTQLTGSASGPTSDATPVFHPTTAVFEDRVECSLNGSAWFTCSSPLEPGPLAEGHYTLRARAVDPAGNADPTPATMSFQVDTRAPEVTIASGPSGRTTNATPRFEFNADEANVTFLCAFNHKPLGPCSEASAHQPAGQVGDGSYSFQVQAIDPARNRSATLSRPFEVDRRGPTASIVAPPSPTGDPTPTFQLRSSEQASTFECRLDPAVFAPCPSAFTPKRLADGTHAIEVRALDDLGNRGPVSRHTFVVDTRAPDTFFLAPVPQLLDVRELVVRFGADEGGARLQCSTDAAAFADCSSPLTLNGLLNGGHNIRVRAIDAAGNVDATPAIRSFTVALQNQNPEPEADTTPPETTIDAVRRVSKRRTRIRFSADEAGASFECSLDRRKFRPCGSTHRPGRLKRGRHIFRVRAVDVAGNVDKTPAKRRLRVR